MNGIQVTNFHNRTGPLNHRIYARPQSINQARRPEFYKYTRLTVSDPLGQIKSKFRISGLESSFEYYLS